MESPYQDGLTLGACGTSRWIWRVSRLPLKIMVTSFGDCTMKSCPPPSTMNPGTPPGLHDERGVNAILPASTSSLSFFMTSLAHCFRLGLLMSPTRNVGCSEVLFGVYR